MVTIGSDALPGTITTIDSSANVGSAINAPGVPVFIGQAYLPDGSANAEQVYRVRRASRATSLFGPADKSLLTDAIHGALVEGASIVYAVAANENQSTTQDLSGTSSTSITLNNAPVQEVAGDITFNINGTDKTTVLYYDGDPAEASVGQDEVYLNPQSGKAEADESAGNTGDDVEYTYVDYQGAVDAVETATIQDGETYLRDVADFLVAVDENEDAKTVVVDKSKAMDDNGWFNITLAGAGEPYILDKNTNTDETSSYSNPFDTSRAQLIYPSRDNGNTVIGEYAGRRAAIGIDSIPMFETIQSVSTLQRTLDQSQKENLINAYVNPLEARRSNVLIYDDLTTVSDSNSSESSWRRGFARLVTDFVAERAEERAEPFIGDFNERSTLNSLRGNVSSDLKDLHETGQVVGFSLLVEKIDSTSAVLDIGIQTAKPLRNIDIQVTTGDVSGGVVIQGGGN